MGEFINEKLFEKIAPQLHSKTGAHDLSHVLRVCRIAREIAVSEKADVRMVEAMALLHDLVRYEDEREDTSVDETLAQSKRLLEELGYENRQIGIILHGIAAHSLHSRLQIDPASLEAKILFDADKIDSVGEIGIARWFMSVGHRQVSVQNAAQIYLDTLFREQQKRGGQLYTALGNRLITPRLEYTVGFLQKLIASLS